MSQEFQRSLRDLGVSDFDHRIITDTLLGFLSNENYSGIVDELEHRILIRLYQLPLTIRLRDEITKIARELNVITSNMMRAELDNGQVGQVDHVGQV